MKEWLSVDGSGGRCSDRKRGWRRGSVESEEESTEHLRSFTGVRRRG
jgi:hypothetical protein